MTFVPSMNSQEMTPLVKKQIDDSDVQIIVNQELLEKLKLEHEQTAETIGSELVSQEQRIRELQETIESISDELNNLENPKKMAFKTTLGSIGAFISVYGSHILANFVSGGLTTTALVTGLSNPVGWGCALGFSVIVGGAILFKIYTERKQYTKMLETLRTSHAQHLEDIQEIKEELEKQKTQFMSQLQTQEARIKQLEQQTPKGLQEQFEKQETKWREKLQVHEQRFEMLLNKMEKMHTAELESSHKQFEEEKTAIKQKSEEQRDKLLLTVHELEKSNGEKCGICMERNWDTRLAACDHVLCKECALKCYAQHMQCPACRTPISDADMKPVYQI